MPTSNRKLPVPIEWIRERKRLKKRLVVDDVEPWAKGLDNPPRLIGGVDLSFVRNSDEACAALVVCAFPSMEVLYKDFEMVRLTAPYRAGFLAFREAEPLKLLIQRVRKNRPDMTPDVVIVDGNGILHREGFGLASHLGVIADIPTIGVAKKLYVMEDKGLRDDGETRRKIYSLSKKGEYYPLQADGQFVGAALRTCNEASTPVFVSPGHRVSIGTAIKVINCCSRFRIPEPQRQADLTSRRYIRDKFYK